MASERESGGSQGIARRADEGAAVSGEQKSRFEGYLVVAASTCILFVGIGYTNSFGVFEVYYETKLFPHELPEKIIVIGTTSASLYFILGVLTGRFADVAGHRTALLIGSALMIGAMFAASVSTTYLQLLLTQGLMFGVGLAFVYPTATTISRQYFESRQYGLVNGIVVSGGALGGCVLPYSFRQSLDAHGLAATFRILGYLAIGLLTPSVAVFAFKTPTRTTGPRQVLVDLSLLRDGRFVGLAVACTIAMAGFLPRYFLVTSSAIAEGVKPPYAYWILGIMNGCSIIGRVGIGYLSDRLGPVTALSASFVLCAIGHFAFWLPPVAVQARGEAVPTTLFTLFVVYVGIFGSGFISLFPVVVAHLFGGREALASKTGLLNTFVGFSTLAGPSVVYAIVGDGRHKHWILGVIVSGLFLLLGGLLLLGSSTLPSKTQRTASRAVRNDEITPQRPDN